MLWIVLIYLAELYVMYVIAKEVFADIADQQKKLSDLKAQLRGLNVVIEQQKKRLFQLTKSEL